MKISSGILGAAVGPRIHPIDARWLMAYAAALGETAPEYLDTTRAGGLLAHPLFSVCYEWPLAVDLRAKTLTDEVALRGVHATHDLTIHRRPRAGDRLSITAAITSVEPRPPGAYVVTRFETLDAGGRPVTTTDYGSLYLDVECEGGSTRPSPRPSPQRGEGEVASPDWTADIAIPANLAHVYTECARIWNPIHTDRAVALGAGLPDIILHGTATLALAVSEALRREPEGAAAAVARVRCRFGGMVRLPSTLRVEGWQRAKPGAGRAIAFQTLGADGRPVVRDGWMELTT
jgi:acyl dehydratase